MNSACSTTQGAMASPEKTDPSVSSDFKVCVRCRPLSVEEQRIGSTEVVQVDNSANTITIDDPRGNEGDTERRTRAFAYDTVYGPTSTEHDVYGGSARTIVDAVLEGYNGTIFTYGQTGAAERFTERHGIVPNTFEHIFTSIDQAAPDVRYSVQMSCFEIYQEYLYDLLADDLYQKLQIKESKEVGVYVKDLTSTVVNSSDEMLSLFKRANTNSMIRVTHMSARSSKVNSFCAISIERKETFSDGAHVTKLGKLYLVNLAGSERAPKTRAEGHLLKEAARIGISISSFGSVVSALTDDKSKFVPYRNSTVTRLLQYALGGNCKTLMIVNIGPASCNYEETLSSLRYAQRASKILNKATVQIQANT